MHSVLNGLFRLNVWAQLNLKAAKKFDFCLLKVYFKGLLRSVQTRLSTYSADVQSGAAVKMSLTEAPSERTMGPLPFISFNSIHGYFRLKAATFETHKSCETFHNITPDCPRVVPERSAKRLAGCEGLTGTCSALFLADSLVFAAQKQIHPL